MTRRLRFAILVCALALIPASGALAAPDRTAELTVGQTYNWDGTTTVGTNLNFHNSWPWVGPTSGVIPAENCSKEATWYCDSILFHLVNPVPDTDLDGILRRTFNVGVNQYQVPVSDFDMRIWESNAQGARLSEIGDTGANPGEPESFSTSITTTRTQPDKYVLVEVGYWAAAGSYKGTAQF